MAPRWTILPTSEFSYVLKVAEKLTISKHKHKDYYVGFCISQNLFNVLLKTLEEVN